MNITEIMALPTGLLRRDHPPRASLWGDKVCACVREEIFTPYTVYRIKTLHNVFDVRLKAGITIQKWPCNDKKYIYTYT